MVTYNLYQVYPQVKKAPNAKDVWSSEPALGSMPRSARGPYTGAFPGCLKNAPQSWLPFYLHFLTYTSNHGNHANW